MADEQERQYGAGHALIGKNYSTSDLEAKATGRAKFAEDYRAEGMLFCKLLLSPWPHARVKRIHAEEALAMPGVKGMLTADELPAPADSVMDDGTVFFAGMSNTAGIGISQTRVHNQLDHSQAVCDEIYAALYKSGWKTPGFTEWEN